MGAGSGHDLPREAVTLLAELGALEADPALSGLGPLAVAGAWSSASRAAHRGVTAKGAAGRGEGPLDEVLDRRFRASILALEPLVAVALAVAERELWWVKGLPLEPRPRLEHEHFAPSTLEPSPLASSLELELTLHRWAHEEPSRASGLSMGARVAGSWLPALGVSTEPSLELGGVLYLGRAEPWARAHEAALFVLVLPARLVRVGRNRLWRLRPEPAARLEPRARELLTRGRAGALRLS